MNTELKIVRTQKEILDRIAEHSKFDPLSMALDTLSEWVDYGHRVFAAEANISREQFEEEMAIERQPVAVQMAMYLPLAESNAREERTIPSLRSMLHFRNWLWLVGEDELAESMLMAVEDDPFGVARLQTVRKFLTDRGLVGEQ